MTFHRNRRFWVVAGMLAVIAAGGVLLWRVRAVLPVAELLDRLPRQNRLIASFDVDALRRAGLLKTLASGQDPDYRDFVAATGLDYLKDLDTVLVAYGEREAHIFVRGRFDFSKLRAHAESKGGSCTNSVCRVKGTNPGVIVGFARIDTRTLAVTSSTDADAIETLRKASPGASPVRPQPKPVWFFLAPSLLKEQILPQRLAMFATAALECKDVYVGMGAGQSGTGYEARLQADCGSEDQASQAVRELQGATTMLTRLLEREKKDADPADLTSVLAKGEFRTEGNRLVGVWPIEPALLESLQP